MTGQMILITGGAYEGKGEYAALHYPGRRIIADYHLTVRRQIADGQDPLAEAERLVSAEPEAVILMDELGCGIVPMDREECVWREVSGRTACFLAGRAEAVIRVVCGIGMRLA